jgi:U4/U6 small nuclear ribonucleoprotein PRP4
LSSTSNPVSLMRGYEDFVNGIGPYVVKESQYADTRCVSRGCLSPDEQLFATSGWSGNCNIWGVPDCQLRTELKGHKDRVVNIRFHPQAGQIQEDGPNVATASADGKVKLWSLNPEYEF